MAILQDLIVQGSTRLLNNAYVGYVHGGYMFGSISGNAETASRWQTPRTFTIGNQSIVVDGARDVIFTISTMGLQPAITLVGSQNNNGYMVSLGNNQDVIIPKPTTTSTYGVIKTAAASSKDKASLDVQTTTLSGRYYGVVTTTDGFAYVNVNHPWKTELLLGASLNGCTASGALSVAEGINSQSTGTGSHAEGNHTNANGNYSHSEGAFTIAANHSSHAEGNATIALGISSHAEGHMTRAEGNYSHTEGANSTAYGMYSHAEGAGTERTLDSFTVSGSGLNYTTTSPHNFIPGYILNYGTSYVKVTSISSPTAFSVSATLGTLSSKTINLIDGIAYARGSHVEGRQNIASNEYSHAEGLYTMTTNVSEHAEGTYNASHVGSTLHSIGIGTNSNNRRNAIEVTNNGNMYLYGIGEYNGDSLDDAQSLQEYLDEFNETTAAALCDLSDRIDNINPDMPWVYGSGNGANNAARLKYGGSSATGQYSVAEGNETTASGSNSHAEGFETTASGNNSHAEGFDTTASVINSHAEGNGSHASGDNSHAEGFDAVASGFASHAEGFGAVASGFASHAEGWENTASAIGAHVEGYRSLAQGAFSHAEGTLTTAMAYAHSEGRSTTGGGFASHAEGSHSYARGAYSHAEGQRSTAYGYISHAGGFNTLAYGDFSITFGSNTLAYDFALAIGKQTLAYRYAIASGFQTTAYDYSIAEGYQSMAFSYFSHAEGAQTFALGSYSHTEGKYNTASGDYSHAEGNNTRASGDYSHAEGKGTIASGDTSHAEGGGIASGSIAHAEGNGTIASGNFSHAEGDTTTSSGLGSHAEGSNTIASGIYSHAEGTSTKTSGDCSHAEGSNTIASGIYSHAEGVYMLAYGKGSHAEGAGMITAPPVVAMSGSSLEYTVSAANAAKLRIGYFLNYGISYARVTDISGTTISLDSTFGTLSSASVKVLHGTSVGQYSHAEGLYATASGNYSHAEGSRTTTYGNASHAEGYNSYTVGAVSHAEGEFTQTTNRAEHAEGRYNKSNKASVDFGNAGNTIHSVGIGTGTNARKNAFEIMQNGNAYLIGVGNYDGTNINGLTTYTLQKCVDLWEPGTGEHSIQQKYSGAQATGKYSLAEGNNTVASGLASHAEGQATIAGPYSHAEGWSTLAKGGHSHAEGYETRVTGPYSHAEGNNTISINECSHSEGQGLYVKSTDDNTFNNAWGYIITRHQKYTVFNQPHDIGNGEWSITITNILSNNLADNKIKIKKAKYNPSIGDIIHFEQLSADFEISDFTRIKSIETDPLDSTYYLITSYSNNFTNRHNKTFTGTQQYVTNLKNQVSNNTFNEYIPSIWPGSNEYSYGIIELMYGATLGLCSHSEGNMTCAIGDFSHSEGTYTKALNIAEHAQGSYNLSHWTNVAFGSENQTLFSVGCGTSQTDRKNAIEVMQNGDVYVNGIGNYDGTSIENVNTLQAVVNAGGGGGGNAGNSKVFYGTCDTPAATVAKVVDCDDFTSADLVEGVMVIVKFSATNTGAVANLKLNVNGIGEKNIKEVYNGAISNLTSAADLYAGSVIPFIYSGTYWIVAGIDYSTANTIGYNLRTNSSTLPMKNYTGRYRLLFTSADGKNWVASTTSTSTNASAARTPTTEKIDPFGEIVYYGSTTTVSAGNNPGAAVLWQQYVLSLGYSFTASTLSYPKPVYIKCTPQSDGSAIIDATHPYVQDLPTTEDGYIYIFLGIAYSASAVELKMNHPVYYYSNGKIRIWTGVETIESIPSSGYGQVKSIEVCQTPGNNPNTLYIVL